MWKILQDRLRFHEGVSLGSRNVVVCVSVAAVDTKPPQLHSHSALK